MITRHFMRFCAEWIILHPNNANTVDIGRVYNILIQNLHVQSCQFWTQAGMPLERSGLSGTRLEFQK